MSMDLFADKALQFGKVPGHEVQIQERQEPPQSHQYGQNIALSEVITASKLFQGLQPREVAEMASRLQPVHCKRGDCILEQGTRHGRLYIIFSGQVSILLQNGAEPYIISQLGPGECFGEMSLITGDPASATVRAERDTALWSLTHQDFIALIGACPTLLSNINAILAQRLARLNQRLDPAHSAETIRLAHLEDSPGALAGLSYRGCTRQAQPEARPADRYG